MIYFPIPTKAKPLIYDVQFVGNFASPTPGQYNFLSPANQGKEICNLQQNSIYLLERLSISASLPEEVFLDSIVEDPLKFTFQERQSKSFNILPEPISISKYRNDTEFVIWLYTDKSDNGLLGSMSGSLFQVAETVGVLNIKINISLTLYRINDTNWVKNFRSNLSSNAGSTLRQA